METTCPHCSQGIEIAPDILESLQGSPHFDCPACGGAVAVPEVPAAGLAPRAPRPRPVAPPVGKKPGPRYSGAAEAQAAWEQAGKSPAKPVRTVTAETNRGMNRNLRILGAVVLLVLGGLAAFIASRQGGNIFNIKKDITNEVVRNKFFTDLIASGATTLESLQISVAGFQPYGTGYVGVSREKLTAAQAVDLGKRLGGEVLTIDDSAPASRDALFETLTEGFPDLGGSTTWVMRGGEPQVIDSPVVNPVTTLDRPRKAFFGWRLPLPGPDPNASILAIKSTEPAVPRIFNVGEWLMATVDYHNTGQNPVSIWARPYFHGKISNAAISSASPSYPTGKGTLKSGFAFNGTAEIDEVRVTMFDQATKKNVAFASLPVQASWRLDLSQWDIELVSLKAPALLSPAKAVSLRAVAGEKFKVDVTAQYKTPVLAKLASNLKLKDAGILPPEFLQELQANHAMTWHFDTQSRPGYEGVNGEGEISFDLTGYAPKEAGTYTFDMNLGLFDRQTWATRVMKDYKVTLSVAPAPAVKTEVPVAAPPTAIPTWTSLEGKAIQAEFVRLETAAVVIRKDGREFTLPFAKLKPESVVLAKKLGAETLPK